MTGKKYRIVLIGAGNVATHLGLALLKSKHSILQICSLRSSSSKKLAALLKCKSTNSIEKIDPSADIYIIAVTDDSIEKVANKLKIKNKIVLHTSGSIDMKALDKSSDNIGVLYPLQSFSKGRNVDFTKVPLCLEANNDSTFRALFSLAKSLSTTVLKINSNQRKKIHLAAVFANNFTNHLYTIAQNILSENNISLEILKPLIEETSSKIKNNSPSKMQTGPAVRGDKKTMNTHLQLLSQNKNYQKLYKLISNSIIKSSKTN